ncbi:DUF4174 domain-containing protein [Methylopila sp. M107]|uniref:DUF4174 domain-containing protein n=1 Tax=Methylopila sp. M107 TaxID=1101190 RepID=UPI00035D8679|nr:DUF4174 domain-containing protein [Methylopila sp. M107]
MKILAALASSSLLALSSLCAPMAAQGAGLEPYRQKARPILIFAPRHGDRQVGDQLGRLKVAGSELADRDMPVLIVTGRDVADLTRGGVSADQEDGAELRRTFHVPDETFTILLIGEDGGEKLRSDKPIDAARLTAVFAAAPHLTETQSTAR